MRDPNFAFAMHGDSGSAGGKGAFPFACGRQAMPLPAMTCIRGGQHDQLAAYRVADEYSMRCIPKRHLVEEAGRVGIGKLQNPMRAGIRGFVDTGIFSRTDAQQECGPVVNGVNVAEVERLRSGDG